MSRTDKEDTSAFNTTIKIGRFSHSRKILTGNESITNNGSIVNFFDPNGATRVITLPALQVGRFFIIGNVGATYSITVKDAAAATVCTLSPGDTTFAFASAGEWQVLHATLTVFTNLLNGLVPAPNSAVPGSLFLRDDGQWGQVQVVGIVDSFKYVTDGTNTAIGSGPDTLRIRSSTSKIGVTVTNNEAVFGDNVNLTVLEAAVDHNALLNYVADQHVAHSGVTLTAGLGISGGGTIAASRTFAFDPSELTIAVPVLTDYMVFDLAAGGPRRGLLSAVNGVLDHNALLNYSANRHIDHTAVSISAGSGLTGGGDISANRTLSLDINGLTADTLASGDFFAFYDISGGDNNKVTFANLTASLDHNSLLNYVADQHVAHSGVTLTAGAGLTGGGTIAASRTFAVGQGVGILVNADDVAIDINGLTTDASPASADFVATYDTSATTHKKVAFSYFAPLASPTFTGVPAGPTAALATNTTQLATTAFVLANAGTGTGTFNQYEYTATAGQTTFSGADINGATLAYSVGYIEVFLNGSKLNKADFTASSGSSVVVAALSASDQLTIIAFSITSVLSAVLKAGDTMTGTLSGTSFVASGIFSSTAKSHLFGTASGTAAGGALAQADANILLYNNSANNWAGMGTDTSGNLWFRTGLSGTPAAALYFDTNQNANFLAEVAWTGSAWTAYTPTVTANSGSFTTTSSSGRYKQIGKTVHFSVVITITTVGTGTYPNITLPPIAPASYPDILAHGYESASTAKGLNGRWTGGVSTTMIITFYDNSDPAASGRVYRLRGTYEAA